VALLKISPADWNSLVASLPGSHLLQTWEWGQVKAKVGWHPSGIIWNEDNEGRIQHTRVEFPQSVPADEAIPTTVSDGYTKFEQVGSLPARHLAAALMLSRTLPVAGLAARIRILYAPKGPLLDWSITPLRRKVLDDLGSLAHQQGAIFVKIDPDVSLGEGIPGQPEARTDPTGLEVTTDLKNRSWHYSNEQIQFRNTVLIDLSPSEEVLLALMKQKTRYNIRLAERKGVSIRVGTPADWRLIYRMYAETSVRDGFVIRDEEYYRAVWDIFSQNLQTRSVSVPTLEPLIAEVDGEPVAGVLVYRFSGKAWYLSGMSADKHREKMPNYLLQWEAMRRLKASGCAVYDLWGAPEAFNEQDPLSGVFRFKEGLGGTVVRTLGAWDYPARPVLYRLYTQILPRLLDFMRRRGKTQTKKVVLGS
jgi:lipid II:glycine glycyltransferase (peptidoglycan interpeptide bridge formation enzyme)